MPFDKSLIRPGLRLTADGGHVETDPRRRGIYKGKFLTSDAPASEGGVQFGKSAFSPEQRDYGISEMVRRLQLVRQQLDAQTQAIKQQRR